MPKDRSSSSDFTGPLRRLLLAVLVLALVGIFLLWRIDSPRVERFRAQVTDRFVPNLDWAMAPVTGTINLLRDFVVWERRPLLRSRAKAIVARMEEEARPSELNGESIL